MLHYPHFLEERLEKEREAGADYRVGTEAGNSPGRVDKIRGVCITWPGPRTLTCVLTTSQEESPTLGKSSSLAAPVSAQAHITASALASPLAPELCWPLSTLQPEGLSRGRNPHLHSAA